jgi:NAD(P)-dependent dehydrogenase (short-subunit alcohol dehydrogenase family)
MMQLHTGRLVDPREVADAVLLLVSPRSGSTSGTELVVDGGMVRAA